MIVQRVVGHIIFGYVVPDITRRPGSERIDLHKAKLGVALDDANTCACRRLVAANGCHPSAKSVEHLSQRLDLAQLATEVWLSFPETLAMLGGLRAQRETRGLAFKADAITRFELIAQRIRFGKEQV